MSATNLFGQYYNRLGNNKTYTDVPYNCSSAISGENFLVFRDGEAQLLDSNGNIAGKIDLSKIASGPITSWTSGTIVLNPGEVKLIEGIEYGKLYKHVYFEVPNIYIDKLGNDWRHLVNMKFTILLNVDLDLREYEVSTTTSPEEKADIVDRVQNLIDEVGAESDIQVSVQEIEDSFGNQKTYFVFESLVLGYDFIITELQFSNHRIVLDDLSREFVEDLASETLKEIRDTEDNIVFGDETSFKDAKAIVNDDEDGFSMSGTEVGHYDGNDIPSDSQSASHYYDGDPTPATNGNVNNHSEDTAEDQADENSDGESSTSEDVPGDEGDTTILHSMTYLVERDKYLEIHAFKYPNGAARAWLIVPEWPDSVDNAYVSLKLNHVRDQVIIPNLVQEDECDCIGAFKLDKVDVFASERNEVERHNLKEMKYWMGDNFTYMDSVNGSVTEVSHPKDFCKCPDLKLEIHNPHIGMYRYLDYVEMNDLWVNVGDFYGLVTNADTDDIDLKNLANSVFLFNKNQFPVKVSYFICA